MPPPSPEFVEGLKLFGCKAVINDARMFENTLLYYAVDCGQGPVQLEASGGAHSGALSVLRGGIHGSSDIYLELGTILISDPASPTASLEKWARDDHNNPACKARRVPGTHDQWVVDTYILKNLPAVGQDGPRSACGRFGYTEESDAKWRVAQGFSWWVDFGQDAYKDFDFASLTLISQKNGLWNKIHESAPIDEVAHAAATMSNRLSNIAGGSETRYGETRGWTVYAATGNGQGTYCVGERDYAGTKLRLGWDGGQWQFAVPYSVNPDYHGQFEIDGRSWEMSGTSDGTWAYAWIGMRELDAIKNGNLMILDIARASLDFELIGTAAVVLKVQECVERLN